MNTHDSYAALRFPEYVRYVLGHFLTVFVSQMLATAVGWELYERTGSALVLGIVGLLQFLPTLLVSIPAGHFVDTHDRRRIILATQWLLIVSAAGLTMLSYVQGPLWLIYLCIFGLGLSMAVSVPARAAFFPQLIPSSALHNAVTWNMSARQTGTVLGPILSGAIIAWTGRAGDAYATTLLFACAYMYLIYSIRSRPPTHDRPEFTLTSFLAGIRFILHTRIILGCLVLDLFAVIFGGATALLPIFAKDILDVGPVGLGWLRTAPAFGSIACTLFLTHRPPLKRAGRALLWSVAGFGLSMIIFGLSKNFFLSFGMLVLSGGLDAVSVIVRHTLFQLITPQAMLGRVYAVISVFGISSNELGGFESGVTAQMFGPVASVAGGGVASIGVVLLAMALWPEILKLKSVHGHVELDPAQT